jgi:hypothetical protein
MAMPRKSPASFTPRATQPATAAEYVPEDVWLALSTHANLLLIGSTARVEGIIAAISEELATPRVMWSPPHEMRLPRRPIYTLLLRNIDQLRAEDQMRLDRWLLHTSRRPLIISTCRAGFMDLVDSGGFAPALYYRLNTVTVPVDDEA